MVRHHFAPPLRLALACAVLAWAAFPLDAQTMAQAQSDHLEVQQLKRMVLDLETRVAALERQNAELSRGPAVIGASGPEAAAALASAAAEMRSGSDSTPGSAQAGASNPPPPAASASVLPETLPGGATLNYIFDGYYEYNFNNPPGRVNDLRAYDVLSNAFSINQAGMIFDLDPDLAAKRRYGFRLDLQFGQATETLQGNPANEPRPEIYRNIFQAYGTYIAPVGHGLNVDVGKWANSSWRRGQLRERPDELFAIVLFQLPALLSRRRARLLLHQPQVRSQLLVGERHKPIGADQRL